MMACVGGGGGGGEGERGSGGGGEWYSALNICLNISRIDQSPKCLSTTVAR